MSLDDFRGGIQEFLEIQEYLDSYKVIASKKQLMLMLSIEELDWSDSLRSLNHLDGIGGNLYELINLKMFFHTCLTRVIVQRLYSII